MHQFDRRVFAGDWSDRCCNIANGLPCKVGFHASFRPPAVTLVEMFFAVNICGLWRSEYNRRREGKLGGLGLQ